MTALPRPKTLLTQNSRLAKLKIVNWSIPALATRLPDGRTVSTCPAAGICALPCYARQGAYLWPSVKRRHQANLLFVLDDLRGWGEAMIAELTRRNQRSKQTLWVRVHDAGDYFSDDYLLEWLRVARVCPAVRIYSYTKEVERFKRLVEPDPPENFFWVYSLGGREDHLLDPSVDRVADVFPDEESIIRAGWHPQTADDRLAVTGPAPVGMSVNNLPKAKKFIAGRRFSEIQVAYNRRRAARRRHRPLRVAGRRAQQHASPNS
ncbi:hypothetical protein [Saccharothrix sp.]|uniref:GP88 family protein n=1 Tax=Saccharothrix sp. TaxID=1873460 RepID=UPI002811C0A0|nr:hypothetical protein [Saccharothrix sp.]